MTYYNDNDPRICAWLRALIRDGHLPAGDVDERSISDVQPDELKGYRQCHFFAGIGGWALALRLAGWPDDRPVWTGSAPCQPFSAAGKRRGHKDERHLWPEFYRLIRECRPTTVFGEQVEGAVRLGWLDGVFADLEGAGYACGAAVLGAHSVGAPHIRQRLYWVADAERSEPGLRIGQERQAAIWRDRPAIDGDAGGLGHSAGDGRNTRRAEPGRSERAAETGGAGGLGDAQRDGLRRCGRTAANEPDEPGHWSVFTLIPCRDGKTRRIEPGVAPLAHGVPARVVRLRGYGNAIIPQVAAAFIRAFDLRRASAEVR
jgi:DNA (cytosine-5)-methyltransferase 1